MSQQLRLHSKILQNGNAVHLWDDIFLNNKPVYSVLLISSYIGVRSNKGLYKVDDAEL